MKKILFALLLFSNAYGQENTFHKEDITVNTLLKGSLYLPENTSNKTDLIIIIAGSGSPDRDGNQKGMANNSLRYLAEGLAKNDIAAFSFDKRTIALAAAGTINEKDLSFDDFITDVKSILAFFKAKKQFKHLIIAGHSEGSLIGMIAANGNADAFISLDGAGRTIDQIIEEQLAKQLPDAATEIHGYLQTLKKGETFELKNPQLGAIFRSSLQPYLISWIRYNPQVEIAKLAIPILIINGSRDIQVPVTDAELLKQAKPDAQLKIIADMSHVFKDVKSDDISENLAGYTNPDMPIKPELIFIVNQFVKAL